MKVYRLDVITLMPEIFSPFKELGIIGRAFSSNIAQINFYNPRDFTTDKYHKVDDSPYGGGSGLVLKPEPFFEAFESIPTIKERRVLMLSPQGKPLKQRDLKRWSKDYSQLIIICGQYEGFDERIRTLADEEVSIGDYVLTGGEIPAMALINGLVRLIPGTIGNESSLIEESHNDFLLEQPHYTRPSVFRGMKVPDILLSGDHNAISNWRFKKRKEKTKERRLDLFSSWLSNEELNRLDKFKFLEGFGQFFKWNKHEDDDHMWL